LTVLPATPNLAASDSPVTPPRFSPNPAKFRMSSTSTDAPGHPGTTTASREERLLARLQAKARGVGLWIWRWWWNLRFLFFAVFLVLSVVLFWLWVVSVALAAVRTILHLLAATLAWLGGKGPHGLRGPGTFAHLRQMLRSVWRERMGHYRELARPVARGYVAIRDAFVEFWRWSPGYKLAAVVSTAFLVVIPGSYIVPRPHLVQIIDDNVIEHHNAPNGTLRYLIHAVDLKSPGKLREYENERAVHLGKIDPQGLKNQIVPGRYYRLWVVGIRWQFLPTLFPNIISATEVDRNGNPMAEPSYLIPETTTGTPQSGAGPQSFAP
jgi:hypothetical protein